MALIITLSVFPHVHSGVIVSSRRSVFLNTFDQVTVLIGKISIVSDGKLGWTGRVGLSWSTRGRYNGRPYKMVRVVLLIRCLN